MEAAQISKNTVHLVETVRQALGRAIVHPLLDADGGLQVLVLGPALEQEIVSTFDPEGGGRLLGDGVEACTGGISAAGGGICETSNGRRPDDGPSRAFDTESGAISHAAVAGAVSARDDGAFAGGDSSGDPGTERRDDCVGWLDQE